MYRIDKIYLSTVPPIKIAHNDEAVIASLNNKIQQLEQQLQDSEK